MSSIYIVPVLSDNYCYWVVCPATRQAAIIDCPDAGPALVLLKKHDWDFVAILNTHHHWDHVGGNEELLRYKKVPVYGPMSSPPRVCHSRESGNPRDRLKRGSKGLQRIPASAGMTIGGMEVRVLTLPGHTLDHVGYYFESLRSLFCGDTLFVGGCGRLFEGTADQMFDSLAKIKNLPDDTLIYCGHEYSQKNLEFALTIEPNNKALQKKYEEVKQKRARGEPTIPSTLAEEKSYNPFLRAKDPAELAKRRRAKDNF